MSKKLTHDYVKSFFEEQNCVLLSTEYRNNETKLDYICCSCGNYSKTYFGNFKRGYRCRKCGREEYKNEFELYQTTVRNETKKVYHKYKSEINPKKLKRARGHYHLDHKLSVFDGFKNNIPVFIITSVHNLEMLTENENVVKNRNSSITKEQLFESYYN